MNGAGLDAALAVVTGGARGIGYAIARRLLRDGRPVAVLDRESLGEDAAIESLAAWQVDVTDLDAVRQALGEAVARFGPLATLVNNAGVLDARSFADVTPDDWQRVMRVNLESLFFVTQAAAAHLTAGGAVVNLASTSGFLVGADQAVYEASKAGVVMLTRSLAVELAPRGIRVNAVAPGLVDTPMTRELFGSAARLAARVAEKVPLGRAGRPEDIAEAVAFLVSADAAYVTGETLVVDGGWMLP